MPATNTLDTTPLKQHPKWLNTTRDYAPIADNYSNQSPNGQKQTNKNTAQNNAQHKDKYFPA